MKLKKFLSIVLATMMLFTSLINVYANDVDLNVDKEMNEQIIDENLKEIADYLNNNASTLSIPEGERQISEKYEINLSDGDVANVTITLEDVTITPFGNSNHDVENGKTYNWSITYDIGKLVGGSYTQKINYTVIDSRNLQGNSSSVNVQPPQLYKLNSKDSYFVSDYGRTISVNSYADFELSGPFPVYINAHMEVELMAYTNFISASYDFFS